MSSNNRSWLTSLPRVLLLLLLLLSLTSSATLGQKPLPRRTLYSVSHDEVTCNDVGATKKPNCTSQDCFLVEVLPGDPVEAAALRDTLMDSEWNDMEEQLQELATRERFDDAYPSAMQIMLPRSDRRQRTCPVSYELDVNRDRVPMLLVHARCIDQQCSHMASSCSCRDAQQYRQVYTRLPGCSEAADRATPGAAVFVKAFTNVTVNCVAKHNP